VSSDFQRSSAEGEAELLVSFVNTLDLETGADAVEEAEALSAWVAAHVADLGRPAVDRAGHRRALALREALRELMRANNGGEAAEERLAALRDAAGRGRYRVALRSGGELAIEPAGDGLAGFEERLLLAVERLQAAGEWPRLKACPAADCEWAFYDTSRNRSRTWCSMEECGNRAKTRRYRRRRAPRSERG